MGKKFMKKLLVLMAAMCMVITMSVSAIHIIKYRGGGIFWANISPPPDRRIKVL